MISYVNTKLLPISFQHPLLRVTQPPMKDKIECLLDKQVYRIRALFIKAAASDGL